LPGDVVPDSARLLHLSPSGDIRNVNFHARWNGKSLDQWSLAGSFSDLGLHADGKIPGFSGLDGELTADQVGGTLQLSSKQATALFPHLFRGPLSASSLGANVRFLHDGQGWHISSEDFSAANADLQVRAQGTLLLPADGSSPVIDLRANALNVNAKSKSRYLPVGIMPKEVVAWLDGAISGGHVPSGNLILRGKLDDFPFAKGQGLFDIRFHLIDGTLDYADGWPPVEDLEADVEFKNQGLNVVVRHATLLGDDISGATARFADLSKGVLEIKGAARGGAATALTFLRGGSLKRRFGHSLDGLKATGRCDVSLNLVLPVEHVQQFQLDGDARLQNVSVSSAKQPKLAISRVYGDVKITADGVSSEGLHGRFSDEPVTISLRPARNHDMTLVTADGGLRAAYLASLLPEQFQKILTGSTVWQLQAHLPNEPGVNSEGLMLTLTSSLQGLGIGLPAPLGKSPETDMPVRLNLSFINGGQMLVQTGYGDSVGGIYRFKEETRGWQFDRGDLVFGTQSASLPETPGLMLTGRLPEFSLTDWKSALGQPGSSNGKLFPTFLRGLDLEVDRFTGLGQTLDNLHVQLTRETGAWKLGLASAATSGQISLPYQVDGMHPIVVDMQRVTWGHAPAKTESTREASAFNPRDVPPARIDIKHLRYNDMTLDDVHAELGQLADGVDLKALTISNPAFNLTSYGHWTEQANGTQESTLAVQLKSKDLAKTLQSFGYAPGITGDDGELQANLTWTGGPFSDIASNLNGKLHVKLKDGRLLEVKPGAGRLFGLLSINALPRRLLLNFSDVLGKGFGYDSVEGNFIIDNGNAYTSDLVVSGPAAKIHVVGRTGLAKHDFDEALIVDTSVGSTLPVLGAIAASSVGVGAVLFILTEIFKKPLTAVGEIRYRLTGTWDNPVLTKVVAPKPPASSRH
jgi:uncharacterized protein (TIGR02099 family)